jgi:hypothetical protein
MHNFVAIVAKREIVASVCRYKGGKEWEKMDSRSSCKL